MIPFVLKHWKALGFVLALLGLVALTATVTHHFDAATLAKAEAAWAKERAAAATASLKASEDYRAREAKARTHNDEVIRGYRDQLAGFAAARNDGARRLLDYQALLTRSRAAAETAGLAGSARASFLAGRASELEQAVGRYDSACRADAAQLSALIAQIRPQL